METLLDRLADDSAVVLFEKDQELDQAVGPARSRWLGSRADDPRLFRLAADHEDAVRELFSRLPLHRLRRCAFLPLNGAWLAHGPRYREVFRRLEDGLKTHWSNRMTQIHMGPLWLRNLLSHLADPDLRSSPWPDWGTDPVVVCGAGLSLEAALPWLRDHRDEVRLVAADTALPVLRDAGLRPDAAVAVEAQHANLADFAGLRDSGIRLFADLTSLPAAARLLGPPPCWFLSEFAAVRLFADPEFPAVTTMPPLGSVGVAAAWIAWRLTRGPVVLAGLDFCYPAGRTHARGAPALRALLARTNRLLPASQAGTWFREGLRRTAEGGLTSPVMEGYAAVLGDQARPEARRTFVWDASGLPLGLAVWDRKSMGALKAGPPATEGPSDETRLLKGAASWISRRRVLWARLAGEAETFLQPGAMPEPGSPLWEAFTRALADTDELWFCFPDPEPRPAADWLVRVRAQLLWALDRT